MRTSITLKAAIATLAVTAPLLSTAEAPNPLRNVYFGEQHLHTANSPDAFAIGTRSSWDDAYKWAMGQKIKLSTTGETVNHNAGDDSYNAAVTKVPVKRDGASFEPPQRPQ